MGSILERERNLITAMKNQHFQPFFEGDVDDAYETLDHAFKSLIEYQNSVIHECVMQPIINFRYEGDPQAIQEARMKFDRTRRINHDAAIASVNMLNRICDKYGVEPIAPIDTKDRYAVADFIGEFCAELYETGQGHNDIHTADQLYKHRQGRSDRYPTDHITKRIEERKAELNAKFGCLNSSTPDDNTPEF